MKQHLLKKIGMALFGLCFAVNSYAQCSAAFTSTSNGGGSYTLSSSAFTNPSTANYSWFVNYSQVGSGSSFTYAFPGNGNYNVCLYVYDTLTPCFDSVCSNLTVSGMSGGTGCHAMFSGNINGNYVDFYIPTQTAGFNPNAVSTYAWDFGDGSTASGTASYPSTFQSTPHTYAGPGTYVVCLTLTDAANSCSDTYCDTVIIANVTGCHAYFGNYQTATNTNQFYVSSNSPLFDSTYVGHIHWDFGDGVTADGYPYLGQSNANISHTYASSGYYNVCLTLTDSIHGCSDTWCDSVYVGTVTPPAANCNATFVLWQDSLNPGTWYAYNYPSSGITPTYLWDFGDGSTDTVAYPTHVYTAPGHYDICLTVADANGACTSTYCDTSSAHKMTQSGAVMNAMTQLVVINNTTGIHKANDLVTSALVYPNPVGSSATLSVTVAEAGSVTYTTYDMFGKVLGSQKAALVKGNNKINLNTGDYASGVYYIRITDNSTQKVNTVKIVK